MRAALRFLLVYLFLYGLAYSQEQGENIEIITYYPPPIGVYYEVRAGRFLDFTLPNNYFLDLDDRSKLKGLNISASGGGISQKALLQVGDILESPTLEDGSSDRAVAYFHNIDIVGHRIGLCGETENMGVTGNSYGVYGYAHSTNEINAGVYGLGVAGFMSTGYGVEGRGPGYGHETGVIGKGNRCGVICNTNMDMGIDSDYIENCGVLAFSETNRGLFSGVYEVGSDYYAAYFRGQNGAPALEGRGAQTGTENLPVYGSGQYGIHAESDNSYAGHFKANRKAMYVRSHPDTMILGIGTDQTYSPEIVGDDNNFVLTMNADVFGWFDYTGNVYFRAPNGKDAYFRVVDNLLLPNLSYIALHSKHTYTSRAFIISSHRIELNPGQAAPSTDRYVRFNGNVYVGTTDGDWVHAVNLDLAEPFDLIEKDKLELGDVVVIDESGKGLRKTDRPYDPCVAGVISSEEQAAIIIGYRKDQSHDKPLALAGQAMCKVDASYSKIEPGDLLTTSPTPGHAMKAEPVIEEGDRYIYPTGTILGIALEGLDEGRGKILVLVGRE